MDKPRTEKFLKDHGVTDWGTFNIAPTPIKKIDISDFWREYYSYGFGNPRDQEYRQVAVYIAPLTSHNFSDKLELQTVSCLLIKSLQLLFRLLSYFVVCVGLFKMMPGWFK